jgi:DNA-binding transcriptional regulator YhcF (GntR family)
MCEKLSDSEIRTYRDVANAVYISILAGKYLPGQKLPALRSLASAYKLSVSTVAKGMTEAMQSGLIVSNRTTGKFVTKNQDMISDCKSKYISTQTGTLLKELRNLGYSDIEIVGLLRGLDE